MKGGRRRSSNGRIAMTASLFSPYCRFQLSSIVVTILLLFNSVQSGVSHAFGGGVDSGVRSSSSSSNRRWGPIWSNPRNGNKKTANNNSIPIQEAVSLTSATKTRRRIRKDSSDVTNDGIADTSPPETWASAANIFTKLRGQENQQDDDQESEPPSSSSVSSSSIREVNNLWQRFQQTKQIAKSDSIDEAKPQPKDKITSEKKHQSKEGEVSSSRKESPFGNYDPDEYDHAWTAIKNGCQGCWSGVMRVYKVSKKNTKPTIELRDAQDLNFRLQVRINKVDKNKHEISNVKQSKSKQNDKKVDEQSPAPELPTTKGDPTQDPEQETGTWTVWNLIRQGDNFVIPLSKIPMKRPLFPSKTKTKKTSNSNEQLKIGFNNDDSKGSIILRIPKCIHADLPRVVFEIGFWNNYLSKHRNDLTRGLIQRQRSPRTNRIDGLGTRRTLVAEYRKQRRGCQLDELSVIQMKSMDPHAFVGNTTETDDLDVMPYDAPYDNVKDLNIFQSMMIPYPPRKDMTKKRTSFIGNGFSRTVNNNMNECYQKAYDKQYKQKCQRIRKKRQKRISAGKSQYTEIWGKCDMVDLKQMKRQYGGKNLLFENPVKKANKQKNREKGFLIFKPSQKDLDIEANLDKVEQYQQEIIRLLRSKNKNVLKQILPNGLIAILPTSIGGGQSSVRDDKTVRCFFAHEWKEDEFRMRKMVTKNKKKKQKKHRRRRKARKNGEVDDRSNERSATTSPTSQMKKMMSPPSSSPSLLQVVEVVYMQRDNVRRPTYDAECVRLHSFCRPGSGGLNL